MTAAAVTAWSDGVRRVAGAVVLVELDRMAEAVR